jgi:HEAT repeat protein
MMNRLLLILCALLMTMATGASARAQNFYQQCESLKAEGEPAAAVQKSLDALKDKDAKVREQAAKQLAAACDRRATEPLVSLLSDADPAVRMAAVETLGRLGDREAIDPMLEALYKEADWKVKDVYASALASFQIYRASYAVLNTIANPQGQKVRDEVELRTRCHAIVLVNQLRDVQFSRKAVSFALSFLSYPEAPLRRLAEETMYALKETRNGRHEITGILKQSHYPDFQVAAAEWIGRLGIEDARYLLEQLTAPEAKDINPRVQKAAREALAALDKKQAASQ